MQRWLLLALALCGTASASAADWPQWMGPARNGASPETGLLTQWPTGGPKVLWKVPGGDGYSSLAVAGGKVFTLVMRGEDELVLALDAATGKELWKTRIAPAFKEEQGNGPRSTPAVDGKRVYVQSANGPLVCLDVENGKIAWQHDLLKEFSAKNIEWGLCASPLVDGDLVLAIPGGKGAGVAAFNKETGKLAWKTGDDKAAYSSPVIMNVGGKPQAIFFTAAGVLAVEPGTGTEFWRVPWKTAYDCNIATPLVIGDQLFVSSGEKVGCALLKPAGTAKPSVVWESKGPKSVMMTYWATAVAHDKYLYGMAGEYNVEPDLRCVDLATGKQAWTQKFGKANFSLADGHLWVTTVAGDLVLVSATSKAYEEKGRVKKLLKNDRFSTAPVIADKKLYLRDSQNVFCLDISGK